MKTIALHEMVGAIKSFRPLSIQKNNLPILQTVRVDNRAGQICLSATNLDEYMVYETDNLAPESAQNPDVPETVLVEFSTLTQIAKLADKGSNISFDQDNVCFTAGGITMRKPVSSISHDEYPQLPPFPQVVEALGEGILAEIKNALAYTSTDSTRYVLTGIYLSAEYIVASDGRRLFHSEHGCVQPGIPKEGVIVPAKPALKLFSVDQPVTLAVGQIGNNDSSAGIIHLRQGKLTYSCNLLQGRYPGWQVVVPDKKRSEAMVELTDAQAKVLTCALPCLPGSTEHNQPITLEVEDNRLNVYGQGSDEPDLCVENIHGFSLRAVCIHMDRRYLLQALKLGFRKLCLRSGNEAALMMDDVKRRQSVWMPLYMSDDKQAERSESRVA